MQIGILFQILIEIQCSVDKIGQMCLNLLVLMRTLTAAPAFKFNINKLCTVHCLIIIVSGTSLPPDQHWKNQLAGGRLLQAQTFFTTTTEHTRYGH